MIERPRMSVSCLGLARPISYKKQNIYFQTNRAHAAPRETKKSLKNRENQIQQVSLTRSIHLFLLFLSEKNYIHPTQNQSIRQIYLKPISNNVGVLFSKYLWCKPFSRANIIFSSRWSEFYLICGNRRVYSIYH